MMRSFRYLTRKSSQKMGNFAFPRHQPRFAIDRVLIRVHLARCDAPRAILRALEAYAARPQAKQHAEELVEDAELFGRDHKQLLPGGRVRDNVGPGIGSTG